MAYTKEEIEKINEIIQNSTQELRESIDSLKKAYEMPKIYEEQAKQAEVNKALANMHTPAQGTQNTGLSDSFYDQFV